MSFGTASGGGGKARREKTGSPVIMPDKAATGAVFAPMDMVVKRWIGEADAAGLDRAALVEAVRAAVTARLD